MLLFVAACVLPAFVVSLIVAALVRTIAPRVGLMDHPAVRKVHQSPTPLGGGIAIWFGVTVPLGLLWLTMRSEGLAGWLLIPDELAVHLDGVRYRFGQMWQILGLGTVLAAMGLLDDWKGLPWWPRLLVQLVVALLLVAVGVRATLFAQAVWIGLAATVLWILVLVNSFNFLDNMDGLSGGIGLIASVLFAAVMLNSTSEPRWFVAGLLLVLAGALAGFLCHNRPPARIFMGDSGSYFLGMMMAVTTVLGTFYDESAESRHVILAPLCVLAVPLYDFCSVVLIRLSQRRSPFLPDKSHFSHRLVELGLNRTSAVLTIHLATLTTGLGALLLYEVDGWSGALIIVALIACVLAVVAILETAGRRNNGDA